METEGKGARRGGQLSSRWGHGEGLGRRPVPAHVGMPGRQRRPQQSRETQKGQWAEGWGPGGRAGMSHFLGQGKG